MGNNLYDIPLTTIDNTESKLADYSGKVMLVVNVASKCGLTPQYESLEKVYEKYVDQGLVVLGFPSNDFAGQEPGTEAEIQSFCTMNYGVKFPMYSKVNVNSEPRHPLYQALIEAQPKAVASADGQLIETLTKHNLLPEKDTDVTWNFEKFLISRNGEVIGRFAPDMAPDDQVLIEAIERALAQ